VTIIIPEWVLWAVGVPLAGVILLCVIAAFITLFDCGVVHDD
jgi:hypothetical protein